MKYELLIIAVVVNALANLSVKMGALRLGSVSDLRIIEILFKFSTNPFLIIGILLFAINIVLYTMVLTKINISIVYPIWTSGGFLLITTFSILYLKESLNILQVLGIILVATGITLIAYKF